MSRIAKPIETLLKLKQIKPDLEFEGADARAYQEFLDSQAEENLLATLKESEETEEKKTTKKKKTAKKVKQTIDPEVVETGEMEPTSETIDTTTEIEVQPEEEQ